MSPFTNPRNKYQTTKAGIPESGVTPLSAASAQEQGRLFVTIYRNFQLTIFIVIVSYVQLYMLPPMGRIYLKHSKTSRCTCSKAVNIKRINICMKRNKKCLWCKEQYLNIMLHK